MCMPPLFAPPQRMAEPIPSLSPFFPSPEISSFWSTSIAITLFGTQELLPIPAGRKYSTGSSPQTSSPSMTLTHPSFSIAPLAVAPLLTSPLLLLLLLFLAPGKCFRTWVLTIYQFFYLSLSLQSFAPTSVPLPSILRKLAGMALPPTLTLTVLLQRNTRLFLFPLQLLSLLLWHWMRPNLPFLSTASNALLKHGGLLKWNKRLVKDAGLSLPLTEVMKIARLTSPLLDMPRQWLPKPRWRHGRRLRSIAGSPSSSSSSPNFPNCSSPRESASVYAAYLRSHFFVSQPKALRSRTWGYLTELRRATCSVESHSSFCSPFSPAEFLAAASNLSSSTATGPDKVAYPMLKHLPRSGVDFLLHIFNLSWSSHSFPSIWMTFSIIPIHKMGKPLDSPASFRPISLTSCVSKLFERIILSRLLFFLESNSILSPIQAGFRPGRSTLDQILYLSQSISDGFNKPKPGSRTILSTIDFFKAFDSVWHPALFHKLISAGFLLALLVGLNLSFLIGALLWSFKITKAVAFESVDVFHKDPFLACTFSLFINDLPASLPSSVSCCLYADNLAIWSSSPSVPTAVEATQGALFRLEHWSEYWCLPLNPSKCEASIFSVDPHQANLQPNLLLLGSRLRFNPTPTFLGITFDRTLSFSKHVSSLKVRFFPRLKALRCISASSWGPSKESLLLLYEALLRSLLTYASPGWFPFLSATNLTRLERLHQAASRAITGCLSSSPIPLLLTEASLPPLRVTLTQFTLFSYKRVLRVPTSFPISGLTRLGVKPRLCRSSWRALASTHPLMLSSTCSREALLACPRCPSWNLPSFTVESTLSSPCSRPDPPHSRQGAALAHLDSLLPSWPNTLDRRLCSFSFWQGRLRRSCQLLSLWHWGHTFLFDRPSLFQFFRWSLHHSARSLLVSATP